MLKKKVTIYKHTHTHGPTHTCFYLAPCIHPYVTCHTYVHIHPCGNIGMLYTDTRGKHRRDYLPHIPDPAVQYIMLRMCMCYITSASLCVVLEVSPRKCFYCLCRTRSARRLKPEWRRSDRLQGRRWQWSGGSCFCSASPSRGRSCNCRRRWNWPAL